MPTPTTPEQKTAAYNALKRWMTQQHALIIELYGRWVSELEPEMLYGCDVLGGPKGLGVKGDPTRTVVVANPAWRPSLYETIHKAHFEELYKNL